MRRTPKVLLVVMLLAVGTLVSAPTAAACSILGPPSEEELFTQATLIFEGVVLSHHDPTAGSPLQSSGDPIVWSFDVDRVIKGSVNQPQEVQSPRSEASCGFEFRDGGRYRVFAWVFEGELRTSLGSGTRHAPLTTSTDTMATLPMTTEGPVQNPLARVTSPLVRLVASWLSPFA
jgi:hypothetical protein